MKMSGKFTQIPDEWWKLVGKYPIVDKSTGEILKDSKGKDRIVSITHTTVILIAKIASFNYVKFGAEKDTIGKCTASNAYFADFLNVSTSTIKNTLSDLYALGLLKSYEQKEGRLTTKRFIYINLELLNRMCKRTPGTLESTNQVPYKVPSSTLESTTQYPIVEPNNKEKESKIYYDNIGREHSNEYSHLEEIEYSEYLEEDLDLDLWDDEI